MTFRFLHLADLHLETSFGGRPATRERLRAATLEAFECAVDHALAERLDAVLVAGDLYDDPVLSPRVELELVRQVRRLAEGGTWFLASCGNHDPGGSGHRAGRLGLAPDEAADRAEGDWRERVRLFRGPEPQGVTVTDRSGVAVGRVIGAGHAEARVADNLAARFPAASGSLPTVGLLHTHVQRARAASAHESYAPSSARDYAGRGYAYWALGHIHVRQRAVPDEPVFYAGNLQGRNPRETGAKGGLLVEASGGPAEPEFVRLAPVRWEQLRLADLPATDELDALVEFLVARLDRLRETPSEELAVVLDLAGSTPLASLLRRPRSIDQLEEELMERSGLLEVQLRTSGLRVPVDRRALAEAPSYLSHALDLIERAGSDDALLARLAPDVLAGCSDARAESRRAYLRDLLVDLDGELLERARGRTP